MRTTIAVCYFTIMAALIGVWQVNAQIVTDGIFPPGHSPTSPSTIFGANLVAWYTADQKVYHDNGVTLATNGQTVQQWQDLSGNGYHLNNTVGGGSQPTFGATSFNSKSGVQFAKANGQWIISAASITNWSTLHTASAWAVFTYTTNSGGFARIYNTDNNSVGDTSATNTPGVMTEQNNINSAQITCGQSGATGGCTAVGFSYNTNYRIGTIVTNGSGTSFTLYQNGAQQSQSGTSNGNAFGTNLCVALSSQLNACADSGSSSGYLDGTIAEVVFTNNTPSAGQISNLDNYFKSHWGL